MRMLGLRGFVLVATVVSSSAADRDWSAATAPTLRLTAEVLSSDYCVDNARPGAIDLTLRVLLRFENTSSAPLLLYRRPDTPYEYELSSSLEELQAHRYVQREETLVLPAPVHEFSSTSTNPAQDFFVTLDPGGHYSLNNIIFFDYCRAKQEHCPAAPDGDYYARAVYAAWNFGDGLGRQLRHQWKVFGYLWLDALAVEPIRFELRTPANVSACPANAPPADAKKSKRDARRYQRGFREAE